ncbi:hypothetical protein QYF61_000418 [Mycteria americana]|uniref:sphingomyelin phosphodiesterase n=1 Tax=Mycteria americana TaxID=33587 RepID=A0AAN7MHL5_MYCAM|nr:hypothetical protein QYF61_000418 [Mycteria americana]
MLLRESPFPNRALAALDRLAEGLLAPSFWAANRLLDLRQTTAERQRQRQSRCGRCRGRTGQALAGLAYAALLLLSLPLATLGLLLWLPVQAARRPFAYQYTAGTAPAEPWDLRQRRTFTFVSANLCLLPSGLAKFSNLGQTPQRAAYVARHLAPAPPDPPGAWAGLVEPRDGEADGYGGTLRTPRQPPGSVAVEVPAAEAAEPAPAALSERFPADADFVCLQEVFDAGAAACLRRRLGAAFPHVLSEVGARGLRGGRPKLLDSGLLLASRYPVLAARYHGFPNGAREDALAAKGLLAVQVSGTPARGCRRLPPALRAEGAASPRCCWARRGGGGSWATSAAPTSRRPQVRATALPPEGGSRRRRGGAGRGADAAVREAQLTLGLRWLQLFREAQEERGDAVAFDVLCGDLNFDNCSRGGGRDGGRGAGLGAMGLGAGGPGAGGLWGRDGATAQTCPPPRRHRLFEVYRDPCRRGPGQDEPWAIGGTCPPPPSPPPPAPPRGTLVPSTGVPLTALPLPVPVPVPVPAAGTLLNSLKIYEEPVSTPEKLKR